MVSNVQCAFPNCRNPVTGQCFGYQRQCGRFYCSEHSWGKYCFECAKDKKVDETIQEYSQIAEGVSRINQITTPGIVGMIIIIGFGLWAFTTGQFANNDYNPLMFVPLGIVLVIWPFHTVALNDIRMQKVRVISKGKPYFEEFYKQWKAEKNKSNLKTALQVAGVLAMIGVVGANTLIQGSEAIARDRLR